MKPGNLLPPLVVLIGGAIWLGSQTAFISRAEKENKDLAGRIAAQRSRPSSGGMDRPEAGPEQRKAKTSATTRNEPIDWKEISEQLVQANGNGLRAMLRFQQRVQAMTVEELLAGLEEIEAMDLADDTKFTLERVLIGSLARKDPKLALDRYVDQLGERDGGRLSWQLSEAMKNWSQKDPAEAIGWFDAQIAAGKFDSKALGGSNEARVEFEGALVSVLIHSDPGALSRRLAALSEEERMEVITHHEFSNLREADQLTFAKIIREQISEKDRGSALSQPVEGIVQKGSYPDVTAYMERIQATADEKRAIVERAGASKISRLNNSAPVTTEQIDEMRAWAAAQAPGSENRATGKALSQLGWGDKQQFTKAAELVEHYHEATGSDEVLSTFLEGWNSYQNRELSRELAGKIRDEKRRAELLEKFQ